MQVKRLTTDSELKRFVNMPDKLYKGDKNFVPYMRGDLLRTLRKLVIEEKSYTALAVEDGGRYIARVLFTIDKSKQLKKDRCGFFSLYECVNDRNASDMMLAEMCELLKADGVDYVEGTYFPYDQDNRRGILAEGFDEPMILTSYNPPYYATLFEAFGFTKDFDTVSYSVSLDMFDTKRVGALSPKILNRYGLYISHADFKQIDREIDTACTVIQAATNDIIFQEAPTKEDLYRIFTNWKDFLWEDLIFFCRRKSDDAPVGMLMAVPDFNIVFRKMNGKTNLISLIKAAYMRKRIKSVRAMLQYVIPEYQGKGVTFALYNEFYKSCLVHGITKIEAGTIMENNFRSRINVERAGGKLNKVFRIYGREI